MDGREAVHRVRNSHQECEVKITIATAEQRRIEEKMDAKGSCRCLTLSGEPGASRDREKDLSDIFKQIRL